MPLCRPRLLKVAPAVVGVATGVGHAGQLVDPETGTTPTLRPPIGVRYRPKLAPTQTHPYLSHDRAAVGGAVRRLQAPTNRSTSRACQEKS